MHFYGAAKIKERYWMESKMRTAMDESHIDDKERAIAEKSRC
jgi:hypothetical protein